MEHSVVNLAASLRLRKLQGEPNTFVQFTPPPGSFRHRSLCHIGDQPSVYCAARDIVVLWPLLTSVASRFASKVTLLAVESEEGGIDDKNLRTLLSSA